MKKVQIHQFDPVIYPVKLFIIKYPNDDEINNKFYSIYRQSLNYKDDKDFTTALTFSQIVRWKETGNFCLVIILKDKPTPGEMAHEATHAARVIWDWLGEHGTGGEADAYLVEWIVDCIDKVRLNKIK